MLLEDLDGKVYNTSSVVEVIRKTLKKNISEGNNKALDHVFVTKGIINDVKLVIKTKGPEASIKKLTLGISVNSDEGVEDIRNNLDDYRDIVNDVTKLKDTLKAITTLYTNKAILGTRDFSYEPRIEYIRDADLEEILRVKELQTGVKPVEYSIIEDIKSKIEETGSSISGTINCESCGYKFSFDFSYIHGSGVSNITNFKHNNGHFSNFLSMEEKVDDELFVSIVKNKVINNFNKTVSGLMKKYL